MPAARFCSECGERIKVRRASLLPLRAFCPQCSPRFTRIRLMLLAIPALCAAIGFAIGHYTSVREPFYFIGTPVELSTTSVTPATSNSNPSSREATALARPEQLVISPSGSEAICGARTKSGRPCQRKVKAGGYCWQHREKFGDKTPAKPGQ